MFQSSLGFLNMWFQIQKITETLVGVMDQVMLDKLANEMERNKLSEENMQLSTALANYLDKFTSPERTKTGYSALVAVKQKPSSPRQLLSPPYLLPVQKPKKVAAE
jgi:hypothetical protein